MKLGHQRNYHKGKAYCGVNARVLIVSYLEEAVVGAFFVIV